MDNRNVLFHLVNGLIVIFGLILLFFAAEFWVGSQEEYLQVIERSKLLFITKKILMSLLISSVLIGLIYLISRFFFMRSKSKTNRIIGLDFVVLTIASILTVLYNHF